MFPSEGRGNCDFLYPFITVRWQAANLLGSHGSGLLSSGSGRLGSQPPQQQVNGSNAIGTGPGYHNHSSDSLEEDSNAAARPDRTKATKEKNRKAQQRFRLRQKEKMLAMEAENVRLRQLLAEHNIPLPILPSTSSTPLAGVAHPSVFGPAGDTVTPRAGSQPSLAVGGTQPVPGEPSVSQMYDELEAVLDDTSGLPPRMLVGFLQAWVKGFSEEEKRVHHKALLKRHDRGAAEEVRLWVAGAVGQSAVETAASPLPAAAVQAVNVKLAPRPPSVGAASSTPASVPSGDGGHEDELDHAEATAQVLAQAEAERRSAAASSGETPSWGAQAQT